MSPDSFPDYGRQSLGLVEHPRGSTASIISWFSFRHARDEEIRRHGSENIYVHVPSMFLYFLSYVCILICFLSSLGNVSLS